MSENPAIDPDGFSEVAEATEATGGTSGGDDRSDADDDGRTQGAVGCLLAVAGVAVAGVFALPRAAYSIDGGFEAHARDWSVILVELPLILLAGLLVPPMTWAAATRWLRPWAAFLVCAAVVALGIWGVAAVWHPRQGPDPGYGPGM